MKQILSLDVGDKRVGVALGTNNPRSLRPLGTFKRAKGLAEDKILEYIRQKELDQVVVGLPLSQDGAFTEQCTKIEQFCRRLHKRCSATFSFVDEYASSLEAEEKLIKFKGGARAMRGNKSDIDAAAAVLILESYFEDQAAFIKKWEPAPVPSGDGAQEEVE